MSFSKPMEHYVDLLDEDKPISGQKFACISFLSPEKILKKKEAYFFEQFLNNYNFIKSVEAYQQFLNFVSYKYNLKYEELTKDLEEFVKSEKQDLLSKTLTDDYKNFLDAKEEELQNDFNKLHSFQTNVRGVKIRGSFPTQEEAEMHCKVIREKDPNHDVYVGPVGMWMPWDPEAYKTGRVEYMEKELNDLMHEKQKSEENAKAEFDKRVKESKEKAIEENNALAEKTGNVLTQELDADGKLVNTSEVNYDAIPDSDVRMKGDASASANIQKELFESLDPRKREKND